VPFAIQDAFFIILLVLARLDLFEAVALRADPLA
jgi:hypothetical protein